MGNKQVHPQNPSIEDYDAVVQDLPITFDDSSLSLSIKSMLNCGSFGCVYELSDKKYVMKYTKLKDHGNSEQYLEAINNEILMFDNIGKYNNSTYVKKLCNVYANRPIDHQNVRGYIMENIPSDFSEAYPYIIDEGLGSFLDRFYSLLSTNICHNDLHYNNVLFNVENEIAQPKIIDYGLAITKDCRSEIQIQYIQSHYSFLDKKMFRVENFINGILKTKDFIFFTLSFLHYMQSNPYITLPLISFNEVIDRIERHIPLFRYFVDQSANIKDSRLKKLLDIVLKEYRLSGVSTRYELYKSITKPWDLKLYNIIAFASTILKQ